MELIKVDIKTKCDFVGCKNLANVAFIDENDKKKKMCFCNECAKNVYQTYAKQVTPRAIESPFRKRKV